MCEEYVLQVSPCCNETVPISPSGQSNCCTEHLSFHIPHVLQLLVSLISCVVACSARIKTDRHRPSTVTLAAHAHRGLTRRRIATLLQVHWCLTNGHAPQCLSDKFQTNASFGCSKTRGANKLHLKSYEFTLSENV